MSSPALTQDSGGVNANVSLSQGITSSSEDGTFGQTDIGFGLSSATQVQGLDFKIGATLEEDFANGFDTELVNPSMTLTYGIENRQSLFDFSARYSRADLNGLIDIGDDLASILVLGDGTRERTGLSVAYTFGRDARFGGTFNTSFNSVSYSGTVDPDLVDSDRVGAGLGLRFEISPRIEATLGYDFSETTRSGTGQDERNTRVRAGANLTVSQTLSAGFSIGANTIEVTDSLGGVRVEDGLSYGLNLRQERPTGALTLNLNSDLSESGRRTDLRAGTSFETSNSSKVSASIGLSQGDNGDLNPLYEINYSETLPSSSYSIGLNQRFSNNDLGEETLSSSLELSYNRTLTATTDLQSSLAYQTTDVLGQNDDRSQFNLSVGFSRDLTEDWAVTSRYSYIVRGGDGIADETDSRLFVGLKTNFGWRP